MMAAAEPRDWLPLSILDANFPAEALDVAVAQWWADWAGPPAMPLLGWRCGTAEPAAPGARADALVLARLGAILLGHADDSVATAEDRRVVEAVASAAIADLDARLARILPGPANGTAPARWRGTLSLDDTAIAIVVTDASLARRLRAERPAASRTPIASLAALLAPTEVEASVALGRCRLTLADVDGRAVGDVLVLDTPADAPLTLALDGVACPSLACRLSPVDGLVRATLC
jgi:flagellar motor switch/type III secretory pathway protein FliN